MRYIIIAVSALAIQGAQASSFSARADRFFAATKESATEYNCKPAHCVALAHQLGLNFHENTFAVCDVRRPSLCATPNF